jgi:hypothetical protein
VLDLVAIALGTESVANPTKVKDDTRGSVCQKCHIYIPEIAKEYYKDADNGQTEFITYSEALPFTLRDEHIQFRSFWRDENPHARDWSYAAVSQNCSRNDNRVLVSEFRRIIEA